MQNTTRLTGFFNLCNFMLFPKNNLHKLIYILILIFFLAFFSILSSETLRIVYWNHPPFHYYDDSTGIVRGAEVDYFTEIAAEAGYEVEWIGPVSFDELYRYLSTGKYKDGRTIHGTVHSTKAMPGSDKLTFSENPHYSTRSIFVVKKDYPLNKLTNIDEVERMRIGFIDTLDYSITVNGESTKLKFNKLTAGKDTWEQNFSYLMKDKIDVIFDLNTYTLQLMAMYYNLFDKIKVIPIQDSGLPIYFAFSNINSNHEQIKEKIEIAEKNLI